MEKEEPKDEGRQERKVTNSRAPLEKAEPQKIKITRYSWHIDAVTALPLPPVISQTDEKPSASKTDPQDMKLPLGNSAINVEGSQQLQKKPETMKAKKRKNFIKRKIQERMENKAEGKKRRLSP